MINQSRRPLARMSALGVTHLHRQNPLMVAWWSAVFPGFGHYLLNQYLRATFLTLAEVIVNTLAHINEALVFSFCGQFEQAKAILEPRWIIGYITTYLVTIWDSYRSTLVQNRLCLLAEQENEPLPSLKLYASEIQYIEPKNPLTAVVYSFFMPGLGQMYNHRFGLAFYAIFWWWIYISLSHTYESITYLFIGRLSEANGVLHPHWLLFMPSVMGGSIYQAYVTANAHNRLFRLEQRRHLASRYSRSEAHIFRPAGTAP